MGIRSIVLTVITALFVATIGIGCAGTGGGMGGQYQDSHSGHSH